MIPLIVYYSFSGSAAGSLIGKGVVDFLFAIIEHFSIASS